MNKNRRKSKLSNFCLFIQQEKQNSFNLIPIDTNIQSQAKRKLLDLENDDSMMHTDFSTGNYTSKNNNLLEKMKIQEEKQNFKQFRRKGTPYDQSNILLQIDNNSNYCQIDNFLLDEESGKSSKKKYRLSFRNTPVLRQRKYNQNPSKGSNNELIKQQKTILNLKKILKKLESPEKGKKQSIEQGTKNSKINNDMKSKNGNSSVKNIMDYYCSEFLYNNQGQNKDCKNNGKLTVKYKGQDNSGSQKNFLNNPHTYFIATNNRQSLTKTSHSKRKFSFGIAPINNSPTSTPYCFTASKPSNKITNTCNFFKRNSIGTADFSKKNRCISGTNKCPTNHIKRASLVGSNLNLQKQKNDFQDIFVHQQRIKQDRKSRNLKNILFD